MAASASSSTADSVATDGYKVFLSYSGIDTGYGFTDFLYTYLVGASIRTFIDNNELRVGEEISSALLNAIKESKISIPIFSKNYASSKWCLLELEQMVECHKNGGHIIYPIFYDVDPSDVRNQSGSYEEAFRQHKEKFDEDTLRRWREALRKVGELKGLELKKETDGHEGRLVKIIVDKVLSVVAPGVYEVFLNFCGKDTRKRFTDFLYTFLVSASIQTFRDDNELRVGEEIGPELIKAIKQSKISIPVFSKNYAFSKWCLLELVQMVECHKNGEHKIYPIFYNVDPFDVVGQTGSYKEAFCQHKKKFDEETVQSWRDALRWVGGLKGFTMNETYGREGMLAKTVVKKVLLELNKNYTCVSKNLVGMDNHIENVKGLLKVDSIGVRFVGIHGRGGLGKTTIAKLVYNQLCENFEGHCFLDNVRENSRRQYGIVPLQIQLISKILNRKAPQFCNPCEGLRRIEEVVYCRKVLIVLDDVDESFQINMLLGDQLYFREQSRIIITTRDENVLNGIELTCKRQHTLDSYASYKPDTMEDHNSLQLFSKYAFMRDSPMKEYDILSKEVVSIAAGLPLVLVVLGSTFFVAKDKDFWEEKLRKLRAIPHNEVLEKLRFSFKALEYVQKQIFLDISRFFIGRDKAIPSYMREDSEFYLRVGISFLFSRSLITIADDHELILPDRLRDLATQIVCEDGLNDPGKQNWLCCEEQAMQILGRRLQVTSRLTDEMKRKVLWEEVYCCKTETSKEDQ